jgi:hypothetical protein
LIPNGCLLCRLLQNPLRNGPSRVTGAIEHSEELLDGITRMASHMLHAGFLLGRFSTLTLEMMCSSETSVHIWTAGSYIPKDGITHNLRFESFKLFKRCLHFEWLK